MIRRSPATALAALLLLAAGGAAAQRSAAPFTAAERRAIQAHRFVSRPVTRERDGFHYLGGTSWQLVDASPDEVWRVVGDPTTYPRLIPSLTDVRVVREEEGRRLVRMAHRHSFASASYFAVVELDPARHRMSFRLDRSRPHDIAAGHGFINLHPYRGQTLVEWGVLADMGGGVAQQVFGPFLHDWLLKIPRCVRAEVEPGAEGC